MSGKKGTVHEGIVPLFPYPTQFPQTFSTQIRTLSVPWSWLSFYDTLTNLI